MIEKAKACAKAYLSQDPTGHDYYHTLRVLRTAETIAQEEAQSKPVDLETVQLIALLHDIDDRKLSPQTYENLDRARAFLAQNQVGEAKREIILEGIRNLSFKGTGKTVPHSIEGQIVQDSDRLDAIGAVGIARAFAFGGNRSRMLYDPEIPPQTHMDEQTYASSQGHTINHFYEKLLRIKDMMNTETGRRMATHRHRYMEDFLKEFYAEWEGTV